MLAKTVTACVLLLTLTSGCAATTPALTASPALKPAANLGKLTVPPLAGKPPAALSQESMATLAAALEVKQDGAAVTWVDNQGQHRMKILVTSNEGDAPCRMLDVDHKAMTACRLSSGWIVR